jgi:hypothetical protein
MGSDGLGANPRWGHFSLVSDQALSVEIDLMSSVDGSLVARSKFDALALVGCSLLSGLLMQSVETAGPDGVREQGPILLCRL